MSTVGIVGFGYVGAAYAELLERKHNIVAYDKHGSTGPHPNSRAFVNRADLAIVCVPTPLDPWGKGTDLAQVVDVFTWLDTPSAILLKSTVPPGTTRRLNNQFFADGRPRVCFSPEYVGSEPTWPSSLDPRNPASHGFMTVGGDPKVAEDVLRFFKPVLGAEARYMVTSPEAAELAKYMENSFLATKVTFCNEWADIAARWGVPYSVLRELWLADPRIGASHTLVFDDDRGFGGRCLPKDLSAIIAAADEKGYAADLLRAVQEVNKKWRG